MTESGLPKDCSIREFRLEFGRRIRALRIARGLTQEDLARKAGVGLRTLRRMEAGKSPSLESFLRIAQTLDVAGALLDAMPLRDEQFLQPSMPAHSRRKPQMRRPLERTRRGWSGHPWTWGTDVFD